MNLFANKELLISVFTVFTTMLYPRWELELLFME